HIPCLSFAFPKCNEKRLLVRCVSSFFKDTDPMSFVNADTGQCPEDAYAAWFSSLSRIIDTLDHATESMAIAAALSRELSRAFSKKTSVAELIDAVRETLTFFIAGLEDEKSTDDEKTEVEESVLDGILASALREGDTGGALRVAALRSGSSALSYEELRGVIKGLIIPESVKRELLVRSEGEPTFDSP
ncbi:MAG: hypothetical protein WBK28_00650, partial [Minisyncoccia bacterium]